LVEPIKTTVAKRMQTHCPLYNRPSPRLSYKIKATLFLIDCLIHKPTYVIIDAPSNLGLRPTRVENLPDALKHAGLIDGLDAKFGCRVVPRHKYDFRRDPKTLLLNALSIREFSIDLSNAISREIGKNHFPIVLGGDCSILIGIMRRWTLRLLPAPGITYRGSC
jgi:arginase family enzyme